MNDSQSTRFVGLPIGEGTRALFVALGCLVSLSGVVGNMVLLAVLTKYKSAVQHLQAVYIINLSVSDLIIEGYFVPFWILDLVIGYHPLLGSGRIHCIFNGWLSCTCYTVSVLLLLLISANRYVCVCHPHLFQRLFGPRRNVIQCCVVWLISALLTLPPAFGVGPYDYDVQAHLCAYDRSRLLTYMNVYAAVFIPVPTIGVGVFNLAIYRRWRRSVHKVGMWSKGAHRQGLTATSKDFRRSDEDEEREDAEDQQASQNSPRLSRITAGDESSDLGAFEKWVSQRRRSCTKENDSAGINMMDEQSEAGESSREYNVTEDWFFTSPISDTTTPHRKITPAGEIESGDSDRQNDRDSFDDGSQRKIPYAQPERRQLRNKSSVAPKSDDRSHLGLVTMEQETCRAISAEIARQDSCSIARQDSCPLSKKISVASIKGNECGDLVIPLQPVLSTLRYHDKIAPSILQAEMEFFCRAEREEGKHLVRDDQYTESSESGHCSNRTLEKDFADKTIASSTAAEDGGNECIAEGGESQYGQSGSDCHVSDLQNDRYVNTELSNTDLKTEADTETCDPASAEHFVHTKPSLQGTSEQCFIVLNDTASRPVHQAEAHNLSDPLTSRHFLQVPVTEIHKSERMPRSYNRKQKTNGSNICRTRRKRLAEMNAYTSLEVVGHRQSNIYNGSGAAGAKCVSSGDVSKASPEKGNASATYLHDQRAVGRLSSADGQNASTHNSEALSSGYCDDGEHHSGITRSDDAYGWVGISTSERATKAYPLSPMVYSTQVSGGRGGAEWNKQENATTTSSADQRENAFTGNCGTLSRDTKFSQRVRASDIALVRSLLAVWVCLLVLNTPFLVASYVCTFTGGSADIFLTMNWLVFLNNSMNWMLYGALNKAFRRAFVKLFTDLCCLWRERRAGLSQVVEPRPAVATTGTVFLTEQQGRAIMATSYS